MRFPRDPEIAAWAGQARQAGRKAMRDPALARWWECDGTWFIGVDALPNDAAGCLPGGIPLAGAPVNFITRSFGTLPPLHRAQLSVVRPGYPRPRTGETEAAFRYRVKRDGAHVDGVKRVADTRRRCIEEPHAWVLGLPLTEGCSGASPLVVWEGSHEILRAAFSAVLADHHPDDWSRVDVTDAYTDARNRVFETCPRVPVVAGPGEAYLLHRLTLHGVAPWDPAARTTGDGRMVAYFRPPVPDLQSWLQVP